MGKGDRKTAKGKRYNASYGNARKRGLSIVAGAPVVAKSAKKTVAKKAAKAG